MLQMMISLTRQWNFYPQEEIRPRITLPYFLLYSGLQNRRNPDEDFNSTGLSDTEIEKKLSMIVDNQKGESYVPTSNNSNPEKLYRRFAKMFPDIVSGEHTYERYGSIFQILHEILFQ